MKNFFPMQAISKTLFVLHSVYTWYNLQQTFDPIEFDFIEKYNLPIIETQKSQKPWRKIIYWKFVRKEQTRYKSKLTKDQKIFGLLSCARSGWAL